MGEKNRLKKPYIEFAVIAIYAICYIVISYFHEPWFDESQAWQIARCASIKDIIFTIPHYEGHPALWFLILAIPAKLGLPYEISLKTIGFIFSISSVVLFELFAPFKKWVKALIPFTFFFFYQYGIIVRPYCIMIFMLMLLAIFFKNKDNKPFLFSICLVILCMCSAYCIVIAAGIAIAWLIDIINDLKWRGFFKNIFRDKRILSLWLLLVCAIMIIIQILPRDDTYASNLVEKNTLLERIFATTFTFVPSTFLTENGWTGCEVFLRNTTFDNPSYLLSIIFGIFMIGLIWILSKKGSFKYFIFPHVILSLFAAAVYFSAHHLGVYYFLILFWGWINYTSDNGEYRFVRLFNKFRYKESIVRFYGKYRKAFNILFGFTGFIIIFISVFWSIQSSVYEVQSPYSYGRDLANFIKENNLEKLSYIAEWREEDEYSCSELDTNYVEIPTNIYPYFDDNFVINSTEGYVTHIVPSDEENAENLEKYGADGAPDIVLGYANITSMTDGEYTLADYSPVYKMQYNYIWKGYKQELYNYVFMRNDLIEEYGLTNLRSKYLDILEENDISE